MSGTNSDTRISAFTKRPIKALSRVTYDDTPLHVRYRADETSRELAWSNFKIDESDLVDETNEDLELYYAGNSAANNSQLYDTGSIIEITPITNKTDETHMLTIDTRTNSKTVKNFSYAGTMTKEEASGNDNAVAFTNFYITASRVTTGSVLSSDTIHGVIPAGFVLTEADGKLSVTAVPLTEPKIGEVDIAATDILDNFKIYARIPDATCLIALFGADKKITPTVTSSGGYAEVTFANDAGLNQGNIMTFDTSTNTINLTSAAYTSFNGFTSDSTPSLDGIPFNNVYFDITHTNGTVTKGQIEEIHGSLWLSYGQLQLSGGDGVQLNDSYVQIGGVKFNYTDATPVTNFSVFINDNSSDDVVKSSNVKKFCVDIDESDKPTYTYIYDPNTTLYYDRFGQFSTSASSASGTIALKEEIYARIYAYYSKAAETNDALKNEFADAMDKLITGYNGSMAELVKLVNWIHYANNDGSSLDTRDVCLQTHTGENNATRNTPAAISTTGNYKYQVNDNIVILDNDNSTDAGNSVQVDLTNIKFFTFDKTNAAITSTSNVTGLAEIA